MGRTSERYISIENMSIIQKKDINLENTTITYKMKYFLTNVPCVFSFMQYRFQHLTKIILPHKVK